MSESGLQFRGRPNSQKDLENQLNLYVYCGGGGAGACLDQLGAQGMVLRYRVQKDIVYNRKIVFENSDFFGVVIGTDAGSDGLGCSHSYGQDRDCYVGLGISASLPLEATAKKSGYVLNGFGDLGTLLEFDAPDIPQPFLPEGGVNPDWESAIFVYLWWGDSTFVNGAGDISDGGRIDTRAFNIVKHDNDIRL